MVNDFTFSRIPEIYFGQGKLGLLPALARRYGQNVLLITGARSFAESGNYRTLKQGFKEQSIQHYIVKISGEPSPGLVDSIVNEYLLKDTEVVIAIGGGSVLDAGKAVSAMITQDGFVQEFLEGVGTGRKLAGRKTPFIAVPTTSGTGSETTRNAVLSSIGDQGFKKSFRHNSLMPDVALVDPELSLSCPADVTAACGMDALTQLLESFVSLNASQLTEPLCISGLKNIAHGLPAVMDDLSDISARSEMSYAAAISGITLTNAGLGTVHGLASVIGGLHDIPHGVVCGTLIGAVTRKTIDKLLSEYPEHPSLKKYAEAGRILSGNNSLSIIEACRELENVLDYWTNSFKVSRFKEYGMQQSDFKKIVASTDQKNNPVILSEEELMDILKARI